MKIKVGQHLYASLRQDQSFGRNRGLQTLFYSRALLTQDESHSIEDHAQFDPTAGLESKWQFYRLSTGKIVISHLNTIHEPDEFGRVGRYLCHSLVLAQSAWDQLEHSPFALLQDTLFCSTVEQAMDSGSRYSGDCPAYEVEADLEWTEWAKRNCSSWAPEELKNLEAASVKARSIVQEQAFIALVGDENDIIKALGIAFLLTPPQVHSYCSFDTGALNCTWPPSIRFWALGFSHPGGAKSDLVANVASKTVRLPARYARAVKFTQGTAISTRDGSETGSGDGRSTTSVRPANPSMPAPDQASRVMASPGSSFSLPVTPESIDREVVRRLPSFISEEFFEFLLSKTGNTAPKRKEWLRDHADDLSVCEFVYLALAREFKRWPPLPEDQKALDPLRDKHNGLALMIALWSNDLLLRQRSLARMSSEQYLKCLILLNYERRMASGLFFSQRHIDEWFKYSRRPLAVEELISSLRVSPAVTEEDLSELATAISQLGPQDQNRLLRRLRSSDAGLSPLIDAIEPVPGGEPGLFRKLLHR